MAVRPVIVESKKDLLENVFRYRGVLDNARGYQKEVLLNIIPRVNSWILAFDTESKNWFVAPSRFCEYKDTSVAFYLDKHQQRSRASTENRIEDWIKTLDISHSLYAECRSALERMTAYFGKSLRAPCRISIIKSYEPTRMLGYAFEDLVRRLDDDVSQSARLSRKARIARLANAPTMPNKVAVQTTVFLRNPDVVAEALYLAEGRCGSCGRAAPFKKKSDQSPYLEVHHKLPLSEGGEDTVENAIALCPNCHRQEHFGVTRWPRHKEH